MIPAVKAAARMRAEYVVGRAEVWGQPNMTLRFTIDDESFTASPLCFQPFRRLLSEQAGNIDILSYS